MKRASFLMLSVTVFSLTACSSAQTVKGPSLASRPYEGRFDVPAQALPVPPPGALPADLEGRLARWERAKVEAQGRFSQERDIASRVVTAANGSAIASEKWVVAQQAISRLVASRASMTGAMADMDRLYLDRSVEEDFDGMPEVYALREALAEAVSAQNAIIESLIASLK